NWALGLRVLGCRVIWLEPADSNDPGDQVAALVQSLKKRLEPYGLAPSLALCSSTGEPLSRNLLAESLDLEAAGTADLVLNLSYDRCRDVINRFRRSVLIDIDPGLLQIWISEG